MYALSQARKEALAALKKSLGKRCVLTIDMLRIPRNASHGDLQFSCAALAQGMGRNPQELAVEIAANIEPTLLLARAQAVGIYVNFTFASEAFCARVVHEILTRKKKYGQGNTGKGKRVLLECAQFSTHSDVALSRMRDAFLGQSLCEIFRANGYEVSPVVYIQDEGHAVAQTLWGLTHIYPDVSLEGSRALAIFTTAALEASVSASEREEVRHEILHMQRDLENMEGDVVALWKKTQKISLEALGDIFKECGLIFEKMYVSHDFTQASHALVKDFLVTGHAKMSAGAAVLDFSSKKVGIFLLNTLEGTLVPRTQRLVLAQQKEEDFHADRSLCVVDARHAPSLASLFTALRDILGVRDTIFFPSGHARLFHEDSLQKSDEVPFLQVRDTLISSFSQRILARYPAWKEKEVRKVAQTLALASMRFTFLKQESEKSLTFSLQDVTRADGYSGLYVLYTVARLTKILRTSSIKHAKQFMPSRLLACERELVFALAQYPDVVLQAALRLCPALLARYAYRVAQLCARYYETVHILDNVQEEETAQRLALCQATVHVLTHALELLNITPLKEM